ncbi:bifunctional fatty acid transporter/acyl-CoA synthetase (FAT1), putative [Talaromyces stipitatus ATCC 10500]|uniref:Bifunctional fatty acid transporter/acyl-CoA synthetase (FAT1), putative n=1 Tax=Talaromyces stipitatus (strain ATCC 10500 / CBS 375.48 / QM 6759 / NRRL 1006) TaxID=441959 RepID=B8M3T0_TALSN|nr:bifunctional fatty acid transporter/acyl-CoA synthetase (FAT1), putative [Talaromyces stipitatus ATCC 10500]EED20673.1 bifunctional fatty acid transporter/acyl-CoA synthetase (FAT1), putative [Talaromyces stipitatus ATCC 10500]
MDILAQAAGNAPAALGGAALALATAAYTNAKFGIKADVDSLRDEAAFGKRLAQRIGELGDTCTLYGMLKRVIEVNKQGSAEALWFENKTWTYDQLKDYADRLAAYVYAQGIRTGDFVAVYTINSPEMVFIVYALSKLGVVAAMINTNLRDETFKHCLKISTSKLILSTPDLAEFVRSDDIPKFSLNVSSFDSVLNIPDDTTLITSETLAQIPESDVSSILPAKRSPPDLAVLIYTSGTTGNPKACAIRNIMTLVTSTPLPKDTRNPSKYYPMRIYSSLPLFHGTAFFSGVCYAVGNGGTLCLRRKFSASNFWKDVYESRSTRVLYIGELCRYLLASPPSPYDKKHNCIIAFGNGLRTEIWDKFSERFNVPEIREIYRSTEGVARFDNFYGGSFGAGAVGFQGPIRRLFEQDTYLIKFDMETEMPYRDPKTGFCVKVGAGEEGEAIGRVRTRQALTEYLHNEEATEKKLMRDVFEKGDLFQRMGDLLVRDHDGWIRFGDRVGDTFRWKGENVSAGEVRDHICRMENVQDAVVFGVKLKNYDGQAGAAGITLERRTPQTEAAAINNLWKFLRSQGVPTYAIPRLVRFTKEVATGVTFKQAKGELAKRSWNPESPVDGGDTLYWLNSKNGKHPVYEKLDRDGWEEIESGRAKL